jgi:hypothetical protein
VLVLDEADKCLGDGWGGSGCSNFEADVIL